MPDTLFFLRPASSGFNHRLDLDWLKGAEGVKGEAGQTFMLTMLLVEISLIAVGHIQGWS